MFRVTVGLRMKKKGKHLQSRQYCFKVTLKMSLKYLKILPILGSVLLKNIQHRCGLIRKCVCMPLKNREDL